MQLIRCLSSVIIEWTANQRGSLSLKIEKGLGEVSKLVGFERASLFIRTSSDYLVCESEWVRQPYQGIWRALGEIPLRECPLFQQVIEWASPAFVGDAREQPQAWWQVAGNLLDKAGCRTLVIVPLLPLNGASSRSVATAQGLVLFESVSKVLPIGPDSEIVAALRIVAQYISLIFSKYVSADGPLQAERQSVSWLLAGVLHDVRGLLQLLVSQLESASEKASDSMRSSLRASLQAACAIGDMLANVSRLTSPIQVEVTPVNLNELVERLILLLRTMLPKGMKVVTDIPANLWVMADVSHLLTTLSNLVRNAVEAMDKPGTVTIRAWYEGERVLILVADQGRGMSSEELAQARKPFYTTKATGSGLGLSIATKSIELMGGSLSLTSEPGFGTQVLISLRSASAPDEGDSAAESYTCLVVEDDLVLAELLVDALRAHGWRATVASSPQEALVHLDVLPPQMLLVDWHLGGGEAGELVASARSKRIPVVVLTGDPDAVPDDLVILAKPFRLEELLTAMKSVVTGGTVNEPAG